MHRSAPEIQSDIDTLEEFIDAYRYYFGAPDEKGDVPTEFVGNRATLRQLILRKTGPVEAIMERLGTNGIGVLPPPAVGGPGLHGLSAVAFADEQYLPSSGQSACFNTNSRARVDPPSLPSPRPQPARTDPATPG